MKYVIDKKKNIETIYVMQLECELCMKACREFAPRKECERCPAYQKGCHTYKKIYSGKIGMSFLDFISSDFEKIKKELTNFYYKIKDFDTDTASDMLEKYLDTQSLYIQLLDINDTFSGYINHKDRISPDNSFESDIDTVFEEIIIIQKIISAYADDKYFVEPSILLQALNEYRLTFCPSAYIPNFGDDFSSLRENPIKTIKAFAAECNKNRGDVYEFTNFRNMFGVALDWIISKNYKISRCENCGKFFVPYGRYDARFCPYPNEKGKSCRELSFEITMDNNKVLKEYRRIYKTKHAWTSRNKENYSNAEDNFNKWHKSAKAMVDKFKMGAVSEMECLKWLEDNK